MIIPITEPEVGYGGGDLLYFHKRKKKYYSYVPPSVSGVAGLNTENKTWGNGKDFAFYIVFGSSWL